ncbi:MAG: alginate lyase family protein [Saprospiraceae bacterium]|nr:alginate lyase family protein [Saprospiraceae bacterium]
MKKAVLEANNRYRVYKRQFFYFFLSLLCLSINMAAGQGEVRDSMLPDPTDLTLLWSRLDLSTTPLRKVNPKNRQAARKLLEYFRTRQNVHHPVKRSVEMSDDQTEVSAADVQMANQALEHVFVGQPAYPPHFCGKDIDWSTNPVADKEWVWQLNRMTFWNAVARVYRQTHEEKYAKAWSEQMIDWVTKNPNDDQHQYAWRSIETGIRGYQWMSLYQYFVDAPSFTPETLVTFLNSCYDHASFLMTKYRTGSNWGLMEAEGLGFIAIMFPEFRDAASWRKESFRRLNAEIDLQVYPDGHQRELAIGYHIGCIHWFDRTYELALMNGYKDAFPPSYSQKIEKMCEVPMKLGLPDGTNVQFGDAWEGSPGQYRDRFLTWSKMYDRPDFLFLATEGREGVPPDSTAYALEESGLYSMRSGWKDDAICLVLKCGPDGGGHCQPDNGTFDLYAGGVNLMPDGGSYIYSGNPEGRAWFRQTKVHQTLTLNNENSDYQPTLKLWKPDETLDVLVVENQSYTGLNHRRAVFFVDKKYFVIVDQANGVDTGWVDLHFQLAPGEAIFDTSHMQVRSALPDSWNVLVSAETKDNLRLEEEEGQVSFKYTIKEPRPAFRFRKKKVDATPVTFVTLVVPFEKKVPNFSVSGADEILDGNRILLTIREGTSTRTIGYDLSSQKVLNN